MIYTDIWRKYSEGQITWSDVYPEFRPREFDSPDALGSGINMNLAFVGKLWLVRKEVGKAVIITAGTRTKARQRQLIDQGLTTAQNSIHLHHAAADFWCPGLSPAELFVICEAFRFDGLGLYPDNNFVHADIGLLVDIRKKAQRWTKKDGEYHYWL